MAWKVTFLRMPCERKRLVTMHSWTMSNLPASCRFVQCESVLPNLEYSKNSRILVTSLCFVSFGFSVSCGAICFFGCTSYLC